MSDTQVNISYSSKWGYEGNDPSQLKFPSGIVIAAGDMFLVDSQNHRVQRFTLSGSYVSGFGSIGSGNDNFFFPSDLCTDGTHLYITDTGNNRVKKHLIDGTFVSELSGLSYPSGISIDTTLWVADRQNDRVLEYTTDFAFLREIGGLKLPESVVYFENQIVVADTGNNKIKYFDPATNLIISEISIPATSLYIADGILLAVDKQNEKLHFVNINTNYTDAALFFPSNATYYNNTLYITDARHRVLVYNFVVETDVPKFAEKMRKLARTLYPTGRAWRFKKNGVWDKLHLALAYSESRAHQVLLDIRNRLIPDNDNFSEEDALQWERALGLYQQPYLPLSERKIIIERKMNFPGLIKNRQHYKYVEGELQKVGFNVFIHENRFPDGSGGYEIFDPRSAVFGAFNYGQDVYGGAAIAGGYDIIANNVEPEKDAGFQLGTQVNLRATFFVGGSTFGTRAYVPKNRRAEFREMVLKLKPAQTVAAFLLIDYIDDENYLELEIGGGVALEDDSGFIFLENL